MMNCACVRSDNKVVIFNCKELVKNESDYIKFLKHSGLKTEEVMDHVKEIEKAGKNDRRK